MTAAPVPTAAPDLAHAAKLLPELARVISSNDALAAEWTILCRSKSPLRRQIAVGALLDDPDVLDVLRLAAPNPFQTALFRAGDSARRTA